VSTALFTFTKAWYPSLTACTVHTILVIDQTSLRMPRRQSTGHKVLWAVEFKNLPNIAMLQRHTANRSASLNPEES
jgi:hypothetical protein